MMASDAAASSRLNLMTTELATLSLAVCELGVGVPALQCLSLAATSGGVQPGAIFFQQGSV